MQRSEDNLVKVNSHLLPLGSEDRTQVVRLDIKSLYSKRHLANYLPTAQICCKQLTYE